MKRKQHACSLQDTDRYRPQVKIISPRMCFAQAFFAHDISRSEIGIHPTYSFVSSHPIRFDILCSIAAIISVVHFVHKQGTQGTTFGSNKGRLRWRNILPGEVANNGVNKLARGIAFWAHFCRLLDHTNPALGEGANMNVCRRKAVPYTTKQYPIVLGGKDRCCFLF